MHLTKSVLCCKFFRASFILCHCSGCWSFLCFLPSSRAGTSDALGIRHVTPRVPSKSSSCLMVPELPWPSFRQSGALHGRERVCRMDHEAVKSDLVAFMSDMFCSMQEGRAGSRHAGMRVAEATASTAPSGTYSLCAQLSISFSST